MKLTATSTYALILVVVRLGPSPFMAKAYPTYSQSTLDRSSMTNHDLVLSLSASSGILFRRSPTPMKKFKQAVKKVISRKKKNNSSAGTSGSGTGQQGQSSASARGAGQAQAGNQPRGSSPPNPAPYRAPTFRGSDPTRNTPKPTSSEEERQIEAHAYALQERARGHIRSGSVQSTPTVTQGQNVPKGNDVVLRKAAPVPSNSEST